MAKQVLKCSYRGQVVEVLTCMTPEVAAEVRAKWPDETVALERLHEVPMSTNEAGRSWLIKTVCRMLKVKDWKAVDRECTGREVYNPPVDRRAELRLPPATVVRAQPVRKRVGRIDRTREAARAQPRGVAR